MPKGRYSQWDAHPPQLLTPGIIGGMFSTFSAAWVAVPEEVLASLKVAGVRGEVNIISKAAGLPLSQS